MTVKLRSFRSGGFEVDIRFTYPDGSTFRRRFKAPVEGMTAARRWGEAREAELLKAPSPKERAEEERVNKEVPTLRDFGPRYIENHALADQLKASTVDWIEKTYKNHLYPELGDKPRDEIDDEDVQRLKARLADRNRKTVNNVLGILGHTLKTAVEWKVIERLPCTVKMLKVSGALVKFYDFDDYKRLVETAGAIDARTYLVVLLGGDAGLRRGEMLGLRWGDVDFKRRQLQVEEAVWERKKKDGGKGHDRVTGAPKGGRSRVCAADRRPLRSAAHAPPPARRPRALRQRRSTRDELLPAQPARGGAEKGRPALTHRRHPHPSPHVLLAARDAWSAGEGHPGARRPRRPHDDDAVHAPVAGGSAGRDRAPQRARRAERNGQKFWRYCGDRSRRFGNVA